MKLLWSDIQEASRGSIQSLAALLLIGELNKLGVSHYIVSPGARSIPLILALSYLENRYSTNPEFPRITYVNDERAAAFMAQGISKSGSLPCIICTSGTAVPNYLPGIVEAYYSDVPVIILTADRPWELLSAGANQTIQQKNIFDDFICDKLDIPAPEKNLYIHSLLSNLDYIVSKTIQYKKPVHINVAFRKPFYDSGFNIDNDINIHSKSLLEKWADSSCPYVSIPKQRVETHVVESKVYGSFKPIVLAGPLTCQYQIDAISKLSDEKQIPIFADIHSNIRQKKLATVLSLFNLYLNSEECVSQTKTPKPTVAYHVGGRMISDEVHTYLSKNEIELVLVQDKIERQDAIENEFLYPIRHITFSQFEKEMLTNNVEHGYQQIYLDLEKKHIEKLNVTFHEESFTERKIIHHAFKYTSENSNIFLSASLVFREADNFVTEIPHRCRIYGNRGATGIDGIVSSAIGVSLQNNSPLVCILGDQAALHDLTSFSLVQNLSSSAIFLIINNSGGAIFNFMSVYGLNTILANSHSFEFSNFAKGFGLAYFNPTSTEEFISTILKVQALNQKCIIEVRTAGEESVQKLKHI